MKTDILHDCDLWIRPPGTRRFKAYLASSVLQLESVVDSLYSLFKNDREQSRINKNELFLDFVQYFNSSGRNNGDLELRRSNNPPRPGDVDFGYIEAIGWNDISEQNEPCHELIDPNRDDYDKHTDKQSEDQQSTMSSDADVESFRSAEEADDAWLANLDTQNDSFDYKIRFPQHSGEAERDKYKRSIVDYSHRVLNRAKWAYYHDFYRRQIDGWDSKLDKGTIQVIHATMGLGKTYAYARTLKEKKYLSAIVFLPTKALIRDVIRTYFSNDNDVIYLRGMDPEETDERYQCIHAIERKRDIDRNLINERSYYCNPCIKKQNCGIVKMESRVPLHRIVLTTHHQYLRLSRNWKLRRYRGSERSVWIIDEEMLLQRLFKVSDDFCLKELESLIQGLEKIDVGTDEFRRISQLLKNGKIKGDTVIKPLDPEFEISKNDRNKWRSQFDTGDHIHSKKNFLPEAESCIKYGCVVRGPKENPWINTVQIQQRSIEGLSAHVFFDGTPPPDNVFKMVYGDSIDLIRSTAIPVPGTIKVLHTDTFDFPVTHIDRDRNKMRNYLRHVISEELSLQSKDEYPFQVLIVCKKTMVKTAYEICKKLAIPKGIKIYANAGSTEESDSHRPRRQVSDFVKPPTIEDDFIAICNYGSLRGLNWAERSPAVVLLGSYIEPDWLQIVRALPFLRFKNRRTQIRSLKRSGKDFLHYKPRSLEALSVYVRSAEQKQAMTRTRHLYHEVRAYIVSIVSKDEISKYEFVRKEDCVIDMAGTKIVGSREGGRPSSLGPIVRKECERLSATGSRITARIVLKAQVVRSFVEANNYSLNSVRYHVRKYLKPQRSND